MNHYKRDNLLPELEEPIRIAIVGAGNRAWTVYRSILPSLKQWVKVVAVCDPVKEHADRLGHALNVPAFYDVQDLIRSRPMEAALILTPIESHYAYSVLFSSHGIHNLVETMFCNLSSQARKMVDIAQSNQVILRLAENFFRFPIDRFAQTLRDNRYIGNIGRIVSHSDFTGYHNNARWIRFAQAHPIWVQGIQHEMATPPHRSFAHRIHQSDSFSARFFGFSDGLLVSDQAANIKGLLGRRPRPGYTEWQGDQGTFVYEAHWPTKLLQFNKLYPFANLQTKIDEMIGRAELRQCEIDPDHGMSGVASEYVTVACDYDQKTWTKITAETKQGSIAYANTMAPTDHGEGQIQPDAASVMEVIADFALAIRGVRESELTDEDACMSVMMEMGAKESALRDGKRLPLPLEGEIEADHLEEKRVRKMYDADPFDVEAMTRITYPRP